MSPDENDNFVYSFSTSIFIGIGRLLMLRKTTELNKNLDCFFLRCYKNGRVVENYCMLTNHLPENSFLQITMTVS